MIKKNKKIRIKIGNQIKLNQTPKDKIIIKNNQNNEEHIGYKNLMRLNNHGRK